MLDLHLFRGAGFVGAQIAAFAISASIFAAFLYLTLYLQNVLGYSPLQAGLRFLPLSLAAFVVAAISGNLTSRVSARWLMGAGLAIIGVSLLLMARIEVDSGWTILLPGFVLGGIGIGLTNPALASTAVGVVPAERSGMASGTNSTFRQVGHRDRHRRPRSALPARDLHEADDAERGCSEPRPRRGRGVGRLPERDRTGGPDARSSTRSARS